MNDLGLTQALPDQIEMSLWGGNPLCRFFLERMEDIQHALETNGVDRPVGVAVEVIANLENSASEALQRLRAGWMFPKLRFKEGLSDLPPDLRRERLQVAPAGADKNRRLDRAKEIIHGIIVFIL